MNTALPLNFIMLIFSIAGMWKIFTDRNEKGWKALVPYLNTLTFGSVCDDKSNAKKYVVSSFIAGLLMVGTVIATMVIYQFYSGVKLEFSDTGALITPLDPKVVPNNVRIILLVALIASLVLAFISLVYYVKLHLAFDRYNHGPKWMIALWIVFPGLAYLYYAYFHKVDKIA